AIRSPSRRLSGERLARLRARDALATAGKMPALLSRERGKQEESKRNGTASLRTQPTCPHPQAQLRRNCPACPAHRDEQKSRGKPDQNWGQVRAASSAKSKTPRSQHPGAGYFRERQIAATRQR